MPTHFIRSLVLSVALLVALPIACLTQVHCKEPLPSTSSARPLPAQVSFNAHIRPLMSNTCFVCHGPDEADNKSGFRIDSFEGATSKLPSDENLVGIKPSDIASSEVYRRIMGESDGEPMPPADYRHQLTDYDKALFRKWIEQGAVYEQHWSYSPIVRPPLPTLTKHQAKVNNPIDTFVLSRLEEAGLDPSELADKATLLRRLSLDLIGLPPTIDELNEFLADENAGAYGRQVERLLASKHFGERMASSWLDIVRFADTVGFHGDQNQRVFPYRDYVIDSFNDNKPFDQFTREQIAGDLLDAPTPEQLVATGVLRLNMMTREGGAQPGEFLAKSKADRVRAIGTAWLGVTMGCCECHNHKYDPFTAKDFYSLGAFFDDLRQWGVYTDYAYTPNKKLGGFNNEYPFPPETRVESKSARAEMELLLRERDAKLYATVDAKELESAAFQKWYQSVAANLKSNADGWLPLDVSQVAITGSTKFQTLDDHSVLLQGKGDKSESIVVHTAVSHPVLVNSIRLEVLPDERNGGFAGRADEGRFTVSLTAKRNADKPLSFAWIDADLQNPSRYQSGHELPSLVQPWKSGPIVWQFPALETKLKHTAIYHLATPIEIKPGQDLTITLDSSDVGRVRLSVAEIGHAIPGWPAISDDLRQTIEAPEANRSLSQKQQLLSAYHRSTLPIDKQSELSRYYRDRLIELRSGSAMSLIAQSIPKDKVPVSRVRPRGNWQDETGELAPPAVPHFLPQLTPATERQLTRLDLADWLTSRSNPLTARHFVNRTWKQFFGMGLSSKLDDLGNQGEWPSHPLLLDWLAAEFMESNWDVKQTVRLMVTSRTYQQAAAIRSDLSEMDPYNRLLAQQSARRLEAEAVRDNVLAISGLLHAEYVGGPSVFPYQPDGHYVNIQFPDRRYVANKDFRQYRRGVYMHWQRSFLHPMLVNFDAPSRDECAADRPLSNSPQQALTLLNDPSFVEASQAMAVLLLHEHPEAAFDQLLNVAFMKALSRAANERERDGLAKLYQTQLEYYKNNRADAETSISLGNQPSTSQVDIASLAAWSQICRVILNLHETITRY